MNTPKIVLRRGGWFVAHGVGLSGPWKTQRTAELARDGKYDEAHAEERTIK